MTRSLETLVVSLATLAALALLAYALAYWTWTWLAPRSEPRSTTIAESAPIETAYRLFGGSPAPTSTAQHGIALTLVGIAAASGRKPGYSVLRVDGRRTVVVREGEEIAPGLRLSEIHADRVVLDRGGTRETLQWPVRSASAPKEEKAR